MHPLLDPSVASVFRRLQQWSMTPTERVEQAVLLADKLYHDRQHWTGVSMLEHVLGVLDVLQPFHPDEDTIIACLLQHALATHAMTLGELEEEFGGDVRQLVSSVHLLSHVTKRTRRSSIDDLRLMLLSVSEDARVLLLILCERCSVLGNLSGVSISERRRVCRDILNLFAPVAARLGIHTLKQRMENQSFPIVYPLDAEWIAQQLRELAARYGQFLEPAADYLRAALAEQGMKAEVSGREKLPYSIFMKLKAKSRSSVESLPDLFALRVIVPTEGDCYQVLGMLHRLGRPVANRFKDYIAFPKPNGYRSLHTTLTRLPGIPDGVLVEVQIRTSTMHVEAEYGIAAHWSYKEGGNAQHILQRVQLQQVLTSQQSIATKGDVSSLVDHIFVLTPKGDIVELPEGATPLDFAFQIHTTLGLSFRAARVNGHIVSMEYELENGDIVDILTHPAPKPSTEWLQLLKMASSRSRLRRYLHTFHRSEYVAAGRVMLNEELRKRHQPPLDTDLTVLRTFDGRTLNVFEREEILAKLGQGADRVSLMFGRIDALKHLVVPPAKKVPRFQRKDAIIEVEGGVPMPIRFAKCCVPQENRQKIIGSISRRGEVVVHLATCRMIQKSNPGRRIGVKWKKME